MSEAENQKKVIVKIEGKTAWAIVNRPEKMNPLCHKTASELAEALERLAEDSNVKVVGLRGAGAAFCSGADLTAADSLRTLQEMGVEALLREKYHKIILAIRNMPKPVVAVVTGPAAGFGCDLALACDLRIASESATFAELFIRRGLIPDGGGTFFLPRLIGFGRAMELALTGESVPARKAAELGMVNYVFPDDRIEEEADAFLKRMVNMPSDATATLKATMNKNQSATLEEALNNEAEGQGVCVKAKAFPEGVAAFIQKREPNFTNL